MQVIRKYEAFDPVRYGNPWVAIINPKTVRPDFTVIVGGYTGKHGSGKAGELYVREPEEGAVYMYGQKDYLGNNSERCYVQWLDGEFVRVKSEELAETVRAAARE